MSSFLPHFCHSAIVILFRSALDDVVAEDEEGECCDSPSTASASISGLQYLRTRDQLVQYLKDVGHALDAPGSKPVVAGMVGYPNVGKSSTINRIAGAKKVSVSATPGKTRHFQTIHIDPQVCHSCMSRRILMQCQLKYKGKEQQNECTFESSACSLNSGFCLREFGMTLER